MVLVRILSGNQTGNVVDLEKQDAEVNVATGYAEYVEPVAAPTTKKKKAASHEPAGHGE